jgi:predicted transcriptional regulator
MNQEIIKAFITLGLTEKESKVLALIIDIKIVPTREFERHLDMRQPEVSTALKSLQSRGWIRNGDKIKYSGMARSGNTYELCYSQSEIIADLKKEYDLKQVEFINSLKALEGR